MTNYHTLLKKFERNLEQSPRLENIVSTFKALVSLSTLGGPFSSLISDYIPSRRFLRLETFIEELSAEFKKLEDKVCVEFITTDEFAYIFEQSFKSVSESYQKEKIDAFKSIIVNSAINNKLIPLEKEFFLNLTRQLTVYHITILSFLHNTSDYIKEKGLYVCEINGSYKDFLPKIFPNIDFDTIKIVIDDLHKYGLTDLQSNSFGTMTSTSGLQLLGLRRTTSFGEKYIKFITL